MIFSLLLAALLAEAPAVGGESYDELVVNGIALAREGQLAEAGEAFDRAVALDPARPQALVERGGLRFLEQRYGDAARDLERSLAIREDPYARDLLASSLHLDGRVDEALAVWNVIGRPRVGNVQISGLTHTRDEVARREIDLAEGQVMELARVREARLRLAEAGIFDRVSLRPVPLGSGKADLEVALLERYGFFESRAELAITTAVDVLHQRIQPRFSNIGGLGITIGGRFRWEKNRPELALRVDWPRPFALDGYLHLTALRGRQAYALTERLEDRFRGADLGFRSVLGWRTVGELSARVRERSFSRPGSGAMPGTLVGLGGGVERRLIERPRHRADVSLRLLSAIRPIGSDLGFSRGLVTLGYRANLSSPEGTLLEPSLLAATARWGGASSGTPIDEMFAPGGSPDMELPLRAHPQAVDGALGGTPLGRSLALVNAEWRRRIVRKSLFQMGFIMFYDGARITKTVEAGPRDFHDIGVGLRLGLAGALVRIDFGHGLTDGKNAFFLGMNQVF